MKTMVINLLWALLLGFAASQYLGEEELDPLQKLAVIGGEERNLDKIGSKIVTNRTETHLNCASGYMNIVVKFTEPFYGIIYPVNGTRNSGCTTHGDGRLEYSFNLPLKGCTTNRVERRVFVNNIVVRFHKGLELEGDEVKTIICRYPSPRVLNPLPPVPIKALPVPPAIGSRVGEVEILMIICAIVFLALLLVGMACSYTCLKKRNIRIVRRRPLSLGPPSEISKISGGSLLFDGLKIPKAHLTSTSDSDTAAMVSQSETLPSDYPSESPSSVSEMEECDVHEPPEDDHLSSVYSEAYVQSEAELILPHQLLRPPKPTFQVRIKRAPSPPRTPEPDYSLQNALSQSLTTIVERDESFRPDSIPGSEYALMLTESEDDFYPPPPFRPPPSATKVERATQEMTVYVPPPPPSEQESTARSVSESEVIVETHPLPRHIDLRQVENVTHLKREITDVEETIQQGTRRMLAPREPSEPDSDYPSEARSYTDIVEELPVVARPPTITTHNVDDRFLTTITETQTTEDVERHHRYIKQYHMRPKPLPPPKWNVAIRHYPAPKYADELESSGPEWEAYSEPGSDVFRQQMLHGADETLSQIDVEALEHPPPPNWNILIRVLEPPPTEEAIREILTEEDREKWRQIITTESTLRTMLTQATVREDYELIRRDQRYERLFEPQKWDVIIRVLSPPEHPRRSYETSSEAPSMSDAESLPSIREPSTTRYRKYESHASRKLSLPPLYEYDSDGNPIVKRVPGPPSTRSRRSSKSSLVSGVDVRSIPETEVNFSRGVDTWSEGSGPSSSAARSHADRSHSELTFSIPVMPDDEYPDTDLDDRSSARTGRSLARSASEFTEDWRHHDQLDRYSQSSADSRPHRQLERSTSEYMEEAPHFSDIMTSPEGSPQLGGRYQHPYGYQIKYEDGDGYLHEGHYHHSEYVGEVDGQERRVIRTGYSSATSSQQQQQQQQKEYPVEVHPSKGKPKKK